MRNIITSAVVLAGLALAGPLHAEDVSRTVNLAGLDLHSTEGQQALRSRVKGAVKAVCGDNDTLDLAMKVAQAQCRKSAAVAAERQVAVAIANYRATALAVNAN